MNISIEFVHEHSSHESDSVKQEFNLAVKIAPERDPEWRELLGIEDEYSLEMATYEHIIPKLKCLAKSPKHYFSDIKLHEGVIVLSDFTKDGWEMSKSRIYLSLDHILVAVKLLGEFHGEVYALKLSDSDTFNFIRSKLQWPRFQKNASFVPAWNLWIELGIRRLTASVRKSKSAQDIIPETFLKRLEEMMYGACEFRIKYTQPIEPFAVVCHGDYLRNNIAFQYDVDGKATDAMMFDFQTMCYASPMIDLCTLLTMSTSCEVRDKYFWDIFAAYHESLTSRFLTTSKWEISEIPDFLKYDSFLKEYARYLPYGLQIASSFQQILYSNEPPNVDLSFTEIVKTTFDEGGDELDTEFRSLAMHTYRLYEKLNLTLESV